MFWLIPLSSCMTVMVQLWFQMIIGKMTPFRHLSSRRWASLHRARLSQAFTDRCRRVLSLQFWPGRIAVPESAWSRSITCTRVGYLPANERPFGGATLRNVSSERHDELEF